MGRRGRDRGGRSRSRSRSRGIGVRSSSDNSRGDLCGWREVGGRSHDVDAACGTRRVFFQPGFDALCVDYAAAARQALAGLAGNHICVTDDAGGVSFGVAVKLGELFGGYRGETSVDGGVD